MIAKTWTGPAGKAELVEFTEEELQALPDMRPTMATSIAAWFMTLPGQALWDCYGLGIIHLRDVEGMPPAHKQFPEAGHEVLLIAYNPEKKPTAEHPETWQYLTPINLSHQVAGLTDEQAATLGEMIARGLVDGVLPAEPCGYGREYFEATIDRTVEHLLLGGHPEGGPQ